MKYLLLATALILAGCTDSNLYTYYERYEATESCSVATVRSRLIRYNSASKEYRMALENFGRTQDLVFAGAIGGHSEKLAAGADYLNEAEAEFKEATTSIEECYS